MYDCAGMAQRWLLLMASAFGRDIFPAVSVRQRVPDRTQTRTGGFPVVVVVFVVVVVVVIGKSVRAR